MNQGWVKMHRQVLNNPIYQRDPNAWRVFTHLLLIVDRDTASWSGGRFQIASHLRMKDVTVYKALKRLEQHHMIDMNSNNKFTTIYICKWTDYQSDGEQQSNNKVTTKSQQGNTLTRSREERSKKDIPNGISSAPDGEPLEKSVRYLTETPASHIVEFASKYSLGEEAVRRKIEELHHYCIAKGVKYKNYRAFVMGALSRDADKLRESRPTVRSVYNVAEEEAKLQAQKGATP